MKQLDPQIQYDLNRCMSRAGGDIHHIAVVAHWFQWEDGSSDPQAFECICRFLRMYASGMSLKEACEKSGHIIRGVWPCDAETLRKDEERRSARGRAQGD